LKNVSPEFKIGTLMIMGVILLFVGVNYLKGFNPLAKKDHYYSVYDKIEGLAVSNPVLVNGFKVGQVTHISFHEDGDGSLLVEFTVDQSQLNISDDSEAMIFSSDLFGSKAIKIINGISPDFLVPGDTLIASNQEDITEAVRKELEPLRRKTDQLIATVDDILTNVKAVFENDATLGLPSAFANLQRTVITLENTALQFDSLVVENRAVFKNVMSNVDGIAANLNRHNSELTNIITNFSEISDSLAAADFASTINKADVALANVAELTARVNRGEGTLGQLMVDDSLYTGLVNTNIELQELLDDLQLNPWKYVRVSLFGRKQKAKLSKGDIKRMRKMIREENEAEENLDSEE
jgi:phospholipid/cholesterol/gamma-HCH transport system substrate-binding protein